MVIVQSVVDEKGQYEGEDTAVSRHHTLRDLWQGLVTDGWISQVRSLSVLCLFQALIETEKLATYIIVLLSNATMVVEDVRTDVSKLLFLC